MEYELYHSRKGYERKNHKYIFRFWKNGKWFYVYKNGKKYNRIQDLLGVDERDEYREAQKEAYNSYLEANPQYGSSKTIQEWNKLENAHKKAEDNYNKKKKNFRKTPLGIIDAVSKTGRNFISNILNRSDIVSEYYRNSKKNDRDRIARTLYYD